MNLKVRKLGTVIVVVILLLLLFGPVLLLWKTPWGRELLAYRQGLIDGLIGAWVGAAVTATLACIAWIELGRIAETASADFLLRLKRDFFTANARRLIHLIDAGWISFIAGNKGEDAYFKVNEEMVNNSGLNHKIKEDLLVQRTYSTYEVDDMLLGHFEDIGLLVAKSILDMKMVWEEFSYYIETAWENSEIKHYLDQCRRQDGSSTYEQFEKVYKKCKGMSDAQR